MNKIILIILAAMLAACHNAGNKNQESVNRGPSQEQVGNNRKRIRGRHQKVQSVNIYADGDTIIVPSGSPVQTKLKMHTVSNENHNLQFTTTGVIEPLSGHLADVASPFEGRIVRSFIKLGQEVTTGTPLFEVSSSDYIEAVRMCLQSRRERELAEKNYTRKKDLLESGVSSRKEFEEAKLALELAEKDCETTSAILRIFNLNPEDADLAKPLIVRSPIKGEIVRTNITVGQYIKSDSDPIVTVADLDKIWVVARVKEKDLGAITPQDKVEVFTEGLPARPIKGTVNYIGNIMNEQTRSVEVYIECENHDQILKSGMFVTVRFYHSMKDAIIIPSSSVLQDYERSYLYVSKGEGKFIKKEVSVTSLADDKLIVNSGIEAGSIIVSEGGIYLR